MDVALGADLTAFRMLLVRHGLFANGEAIRPPSEFVRAVRRERARSDRAERPFSVVLVDMRSLPVDRILQVQRTVRDTVRETDDVGWMEPGHLGLLLPETGRAQAGVVASKLRDAVLAPDHLSSLRIYTHGERCPACPDCPTRDAEPAGPPVPPPPPRPDAPALADILAEPLPAWKRAMDIVGSVSLMAALWPVFVGAAIAVKRSSPGPVIFRQQRAGLGGRPFTFYKFRTMYQDAEARKPDLLHRNEVSGPVFKMRDDPRVTPVGRVLRRTSIDELPQLFNVLLGDMTLVGPRPPTLDEVEKYRPWQRKRLDVTGGLTCIWQVSGRCTVAFEEWMRMDARYIRRRGPATDLGLLLRTVGAVVSGTGAQ